MITTAYTNFHESLGLNSDDTMDFDQEDNTDSVTSPLHLSHHPAEDSYYDRRIEESPSFCSSSTPTSGSKTFSSQNDVVRVNVGGENYSFPQAIFAARFCGLPWKQDTTGVLHLNSSAAVFEVLLDYVLFDTLPAYDTMSKDEFEEFETMALGMGGLTTLIDHFDRKDSYLSREVRRSHERRNFSSFHTNSNKTKKPRTTQGSQNFFLLNGEQSHKSPNSIRATQCARFLGAICGVAESLRRRHHHHHHHPSTRHYHGDGAEGNNKRRKLSHDDEWNPIHLVS
jgi:hypothetical protein